MLRYLPLIFLLAAFACSKPSNNLSRFYEDGHTKPAVAITPVIDATSFELSWSLSEELTSLIVRRVAQDGSIFVIPKGDLGYADNPFGSDLAWIKREFPDDEFAIFCELVEHEHVPVLSKGSKTPIPFETSSNLKMAVRLRVIDLRGSAPRIVLQEMIRNSYYIPKNMIPTDYRTTIWGTDEYAASPMGLAHVQLIQEIASRVSDYIHLAKSR